MKLMLGLIAFLSVGWWLTPDQQGRRLFEQSEYPAAAETFLDPLWQGTAWYRAGEFRKAAESFARRSTPEACFNQGNSWLMHGKYELAIASYDQALEQRPDWKEAIENRDLAEARARMIKPEGGDLGDQKEGVDDVVFDKNKKPGGQEAEIAGDEPMSDQAIQALWMRRVQTRPAEFLKSKFAYQLANETGGERE